jgi:HlyD family secretion protein
MDDTDASILVKRAQNERDRAVDQCKQAQKAPEEYQLLLNQQKLAIAAKKAEFEAGLELAAMAKRIHGNEKVGNVVRDEELKAAVKRAEALENALKAEEEKLKQLQLQDPSFKVREAERDKQDKELQLQRAQYALDQCTLRAPVEGTIVRVLANAGEMLGSQARQPAILFCPSGPLIIRAEVDQEFANRIAVNQVATIFDDTGAGGTWTGKVRRVGDVFLHRRGFMPDLYPTNEARTLECTIQLDEGQAALRINQKMRVLLRKQ